MLKAPYELTLRERYERLLYIGNCDNVVSKYVAGRKVYEKENVVEKDMVRM